jgi:hypothetical protein
MVEQQERSPGLATLAALCLMSQLAFYVLLALNTCTGEMCGSGRLIQFYFILGIGLLIGIAAWLGATFRAARGHDAPSALSIGLLPLVALGNVVLVDNHNVSVEQTAGLLVLDGAWGLFIVVPALVLAISLVKRQTTRRAIAVAGLLLAVAVLVASNLVD